MAYNIYFKFAVDNYSLFGGDENAHKVCVYGKFVLKNSGSWS
jgi:hypothetical protein